MKLGHGELSNELLPRPIDFTADELNDADECEDEIVLEDEEIVDCSCGLWHAAAVTESGKVYTWGYGNEGQVSLYPVLHPLLAVLMRVLRWGTVPTKAALPPNGCHASAMTFV